MRRDRRVAGPDAKIRMHGRAVSVTTTVCTITERSNDKCRVRYNIRPASDSPLID